MHALRLTVIFTVLTLGMVMIWALGYDAQTRAELARAQHAGIPAATLAAAARMPVDDAEGIEPDLAPTCPTASATTASIILPGQIP